MTKLRKLALLHQIDLVDEYDISEGDLLAGLLVVQLIAHVTGIDDRYDCVERSMPPQRLVKDERLDHRRRVREPGRLDHDMIDLAPALQNARHRAREVAANRAADATVVELENLFVGGDDELPVDTSFAEFIDDHRDLAALVGGQYLVEQGRLAGTKKSSEDSCRYRFHATF